MRVRLPGLETRMLTWASVERGGRLLQFGGFEKTRCRVSWRLLLVIIPFV